MARLKPEQFGVTAVLTSCNRHDLLNDTLQSFFKFCSYPIRQMIVVEDGSTIPGALIDSFKSRRIVWLSTGRRVGQIAAIDYAYSRVRTPYIFHMEDDWEFYRSGFIERSMTLLRAEQNCLQVWIRSTSDTNDHPLEPRIYTKNGVSWQKLAFNHNRRWHGFSFNPGLRRLADYIACNGYCSLEKFDFLNPWKTEIAISKFYKDRGMYAAILCDENGAGYVRHTGGERHTPPPAQSCGGEPT